MSVIAKQKELSAKQKAFGNAKAYFFFIIIYSEHARPCTYICILRRFCFRERRQCS